MPPLSDLRGAAEIMGRLWILPRTGLPASSVAAVLFAAPPDAVAFRIGGGRRQWAWRQPEGE